MRRYAGALCAFLMLALASPAAAQEGTIELGVDTGLNFTDPDGGETVTSLSIPSQRIRVGGFISDNISLESSLSLNLVDVTTTNFTTQFTGGVGLHLPPAPMSTRVFVSPFGALRIVDAGAVSDVQLGLGGRFGLKIPAGEVLGVRVEGSYTRAVETDELPGTDNFGVTVGLSFFLR